MNNRHRLSQIFVSLHTNALITFRKFHEQKALGPGLERMQISTSPAEALIDRICLKTHVEPKENRRNLMCEL